MNAKRLIHSICRLVFSHLLHFCFIQGTSYVWVLFTLTRTAEHTGPQEKQTHWRGFCQQCSLGCWKKNIPPQAKKCFAWTQKWNFPFLSCFWNPFALWHSEDSNFTQMYVQLDRICDYWDLIFRSTTNLDELMLVQMYYLLNLPEGACLVAWSMEVPSWEEQ